MHRSMGRKVRSQRRSVFVFVDGVGIGPNNPSLNPIAAAAPPILSQLAGGMPTCDTAPYAGIDARLGMSGLPQSGTGQYSLFTGDNGAQRFGRHFGPWVPTALRQSLADTNILTRAANAGRAVAFANAYPEEITASLGAATANIGSLRGPLRAGPPLAAIGAGALTRGTRDLQSGRAVASEIINDGWRDRLGRWHLPEIGPFQAGLNLARIANDHDFTLFAHYTTDAAGHDKNMVSAIAAILRVDSFIGGLITELDDDVLLLIASDHGNIEDVTAGHTSNPALFIAHGERAANYSHVRTLLDVVPALVADMEL